MIGGHAHRMRRPFWLLPGVEGTGSDVLSEEGWGLISCLYDFAVNAMHPVRRVCFGYPTCVSITL